MIVTHTLVNKTLMAVCFSHSVMSNSVTSWTAAHQASPSVGFSRQQYWSGLPFPSPLMVVVRINLFHHIRRENFYLQFFLNLNKSFYFSILNTIKRLEIAFEDLSLIWKHLICLFIYMYMTVWILVIKKKKWAILESKVYSVTYPAFWPLLTSPLGI